MSSMKARTCVCFIPCYTPSTPQTLGKDWLTNESMYTWTKQVKSSTQHRDPHAYSPRRREGQGLCVFTAASLGPRICPEHGRHSTNTCTAQWIKEWVTCLAQLLTSLPSAFPFMKGEEYLTWVRVQTPGHDPKQLWGQFQMPAAGRRGPGPQK